MFTRRRGRGRRTTACVVALAVVAFAALGAGCTPNVPGASAEGSEPTASAASDPTTAAASAAPSTSPAPTTEAPQPPENLDYAAMKRKLAKSIADGPESLQDVRAVLVSIDGETVLSLYQHSKPTEQRHVWSVTKSVLSILVGIAVDEGRLSLDQTLVELLPEHRDSMTAAQQAVTLRQLLTMTGGLPGDGGGLNLEAEDPLDFLLTYGKTGEVGPFSYSNSGAHLVAAVLHRAVARPLLDYAREKLFDPLGIDTRPAWQGTSMVTKDGFDDAGFAWLTDSTGTNVGAYGLRLTPADLVKIGELYLGNGTWHGRRIVSADWVTASTTSQLTAEQAASEGPYGYLWWVIDDPPVHGFLAAGAYCQLIIVLPQRRAVVAVTATDDNYSDGVVCDALYPILGETVIEPITG